MHSPRTNRPASLARQYGAAAVEFALAAIPFFLLLFGAIEFARLLYLWNTAQEITRRAARMVVVSDFNDTAQIDAIKRNAVFRLTTETDNWLPATYHADSTKRLSNNNIVIRYLNAAGTPASPMPADPGDNITACKDNTRTSTCIRYVEVCISSGSTCDADQRLAFMPMIGLFSHSSTHGVNLSVLQIPSSTVRMPAESLGFSGSST